MTEIKLITSIFLLAGCILFFFKESLINLKVSFGQVKVNNYVYIGILLIFTFLSQNTHLHYETIDWDTNSYLVSSLDILNGFLPYENSWESKQPLFYYIYAFLILISNFNLIIFKLLNDFILFLISWVMFTTISARGTGAGKSFLASIFYLLLMSPTWAQVEKTELYCVLILSFVLLIQFKFQDSKYAIPFSGFLLGLSVLINLGSILFVAPALLSYPKSDFNFKKFLNSLFKFSTGFLIPIAVFSIVYFQNNLFDIFITTNIKIPFAYTQESFNFIKEFSVFIKSIYNFNPFIYLSLIFLFLVSFLKILMALKNRRNASFVFDQKTMLYLITSLCVYYIAGHGYYHHLYYFIFFVPFLVVKYLDTFDSRNFGLLLLASILFSSFSYFPQSFTNLKNTEEIYKNYPLYNISKELDLIINEQDQILATDGVLTLFYLQKSNFSYIVHPTNHKEKFITNELIEINYLIEDELVSLLNLDPKVIICGNNTHFNCEIYDWKNNYQELDVKKYLEYKPYQLFNPGSEKGETVRVFIRND